MFASEDPSHQLEVDLRKAILSGVLAPSSKLLSVRSLADQYKLSYGKTLRALKRLEHQGYLVTRQGDGTFVAHKIPTDTQNAPVSEAGDCAVIIVPPNYWADPEKNWFVEFLRGFEALMNEHSGGMKVMSAAAYFDGAESISPQVRTHIVLAPMNSAHRNAVISRLPEDATMVLVAHDPCHSDWAMVMDIDGASGIRQAVLSLLERGHRRLGYLTWDRNNTPHEQHWWLELREKAFVQLVIDRGIPYEIIAAPFSRSAAAIESLIASSLKGEGRPTALVCANDILARRALDACRESKLQVPQDLSMVGFDNEPWTVTEGLSTVHRTYRELGRLAGELAWQRQRFDIPRCRGVLAIAPKLVLRNSVAPLVVSGQ